MGLQLMNKEDLPVVPPYERAEMCIMHMYDGGGAVRTRRSGLQHKPWFAEWPERDSARRARSTSDWLSQGVAGGSVSNQRVMGGGGLACSFLNYYRPPRICVMPRLFVQGSEQPRLKQSRFWSF